MRAIPKLFLIHSAVHRSGKTLDDWGNETWATETDLSRVRFEPSSKLVKTTDNTEVQLSAIMFFDCRNSKPNGEVFGLGDEIEFNDTKYTVVGGTEPLYEATRAHHYEVELI